VSHLKSNVEALGIHLTQEDIDEIETGYDFELGFPHEVNLLGIISSETFANSTQQFLVLARSEQDGAGSR
jgi:hypothetical protein